METIMEDLPSRLIPDVEHWSENFALAAHDPVNGVHVFLHVGRWRQDPRLWRENFFIALPNGMVIMHRNVGNALANENGPGGGNVHIEIVEAFKTLRYRFAGGTQLLSAQRARESGPHPGRLHLTEFDLTFTAVSPMWQLSAAADVEYVGHGHTEQLGRITGTIEVAGERFDMDCLGNRDHSRGPRVVDKLYRHIWTHGSFDNGKSFLAYEAETDGSGQTAFSNAVVLDGGVMFEATFKPDFRLPPGAIGQLGQPFGLVLEYGTHELRVTVENYPHTNFIQPTAPWDMYVGRRQLDGPFSFCVAEQATLLALEDGTRGYGHIERSVPGLQIVED